MYLFLLSLLLFSQVHSEVTKEDGVLVLNSQNFNETIAENEFILVEFYAPWCGHCNALAPEYAKAAQQLEEENSPIKLAKVDATKEQQLAQSFEVRGYPTILYFRSGEKISYTGGRKADDIVSWCKKKMSPNVEELKDSASVSTLISSNDMVVIGFEKHDSVEIKSLLDRISENFDKVTFGFAKGSALADEHKIQGDRKIVVFKKFDEGRVEYDGPLTEKDLQSFIHIESVPLVVEFNEETANVVLTSPVKKNMIAFVKKSSGFDEAKSELHKIAPAFKGKAHFVILDAEYEDHARILDVFGLTMDEVPTFRTIELGETLIKFKPKSSEINSDAIKEHLQEVLDGKVKPHLLSEPVTDQDAESPVMQLVGLNFNEHVNDKAKDVFVMLYAEWCNHCKQLKPIWEKLGEEFKGRSDVLIAKMDATKNEVEDLKIQGFPTLKYYSKQSTEPIDYNGERTFEKLVQFVKSGGKSDASDETEKDDARDEL